MRNNTLWILLSALGAAGTAAFGYQLYRLHRAMAQKRPGYLMPQLRMSYDPQTVLDEAKQPDISLFFRFRAWLFPALAALLLVLLAATRNAAPWLWLYHAMFALAAAAFLFATVENILLPHLPRAAAFLGRIKWGMVILWVAGMFTGLIAKGFAQF